MNNKLIDLYLIKNKLIDLSSYVINEINKSKDEIIITKTSNEFYFYTDYKEEREKDESIISLNYIMHDEDEFKKIFYKKIRNIKDIKIKISANILEDEKFTIIKNDILNEEDIYNFFENLKEDIEIKRFIDAIIKNQNLLFDNVVVFSIYAIFNFKRSYKYTDFNFRPDVYKLINMELECRNIIDLSTIF